MDIYRVSTKRFCEILTFNGARALKHASVTRLYERPIGDLLFILYDPQTLPPLDHMLPVYYSDRFGCGPHLGVGRNELRVDLNAHLLARVL